MYVLDNIFSIYKYFFVHLQRGFVHKMVKDLIDSSHFILDNSKSTHESFDIGLGKICQNFC